MDLIHSGEKPTVGMCVTQPDGQRLGQKSLLQNLLLEVWAKENMSMNPFATSPRSFIFQK